MNTTPASIKARILAAAIDLALIILYALCLLGVALFVYHVVLGGFPNMAVTSTIIMQLLGFTTLTLPVGLYFYVSESGSSHASVGKRLLKLKVATVTADPPSRRQIAVRTIVKLLPWEFAHTLVYQVAYYSVIAQPVPLWVMAGLYLANAIPILYVLIIAIRKDHRGPHDLVAGTIVTR